MDMRKSRMIDAEEVAAQLGVSQGYAYRLIRMLNSELRDKGNVILPGKVNREYFEYRFFRTDDERRRHDRV